MLGQDRGDLTGDLVMVQHWFGELARLVPGL